MSTRHAKIKGGLFNSSDLTEDTVAPVPSKDKKKKEERIPFYIKALDRLNTNLNPVAAKANTGVNTENTTAADNAVKAFFNEAETVFEKNEIIYDNDLRLPEDGQIARSEQPSEGSYNSIWQKPRIRQSIEFEEEMDPDEEADFDDEELDCAIKAPPIRTIRTRSSIHEQPILKMSIPKSFYKDKVVPKEAIVVEEEPPVEKTYVPGPAGEYVEVVDELQDTIHEMSKEPLMGNIELLSTPLNAEEATAIHKSISDLHYIKEKRITNEPINEV